MPTFNQYLFPLEAEYRERVWGGQRLRASNPPVGEAWIAHGEMPPIPADQDPLLHARRMVAQRCQARRMVGPGEFGKTEAWYFIETDPAAQIMVGVKHGVGRNELAGRIRDGRILEIADRVSVHGGDALLIPAGTLHALGPGLFLYEIQQASDTTYRVYDWDRPQSTGRKLHIEESVEVAQPVGATELRHPEPAGQTGATPAADTGGRSFHLLTVIDGAAVIAHDREEINLGRYETALVAGSAGRYEIRSGGGPVALLRASVP